MTNPSPVRRALQALREGRVTFGLREAIVLSVLGIAISIAVALTSH